MKLSAIRAAMPSGTPRLYIDLNSGEVFLGLAAVRMAASGAFIVPVSWDNPDLNPADPATWAGYMEKHRVPMAGLDIQPKELK